MTSLLSFLDYFFFRLNLYKLQFEHQREVLYEQKETKKRTLWKFLVLILNFIHLHCLRNIELWKLSVFCRLIVDSKNKNVVLWFYEANKQSKPSKYLPKKQTIAIFRANYFNLSHFKKIISEKIGGAKGTEIDSDYYSMEKVNSRFESF